MLEEVYIKMREHNKYLSKYACLDNNAYYLKENQEDIRTPFFRDIDRILYSLAFIRYQDKTQVFSLNENDHISRRMIHVQLVSKIGRTIGRALGLNEDLIEAASLGHDLGHPPFGHTGEYILNKISKKYNEGFFLHNIQSVRNLVYLENNGIGINISVQVLDAIMCHNGEIEQEKYEPQNKTKEEFLKEYHEAYYDKEMSKKLRPMTLEGCVVRVSDFIAYLGRDIEDGIRLNLIKREDIPKSIIEVLGCTTKDIVNNLVIDIIKNSLNKNYIKMSDKVYNALVMLKKFNYENIYNKAMSKEENIILEDMFNKLFKRYLLDVNNNNLDSPIVNSFLIEMSEEYKKNSSARIVLDYIAGMTDDYFLSEYKRIYED